MTATTPPLEGLAQLALRNIEAGITQLLRDWEGSPRGDAFLTALAVVQRERSALNTRVADKGGEVVGEWVMVPREPTKAMVAAWTDAGPDIFYPLSGVSDDEVNEQCATADWSAMLLAAPSAPTPANLGDALADEWPTRAIRIAEALEAEVMSERDGSLWCRLCKTDTGADGQDHAQSCVLFNDQRSAG